MITQEQVGAFSMVRNELKVGALADLRSLLASLDGLEPKVARGVLFEAFPEVFNAYATGSSEVAAQFYEELRTQAGVKAKFTPQAAKVAVPKPSWTALVGIGAPARMLEQGGAMAAYMALAGGLTKRLTQAAADTMRNNASAESVQVGVQRVPKAGCCAFCSMLASRGSKYDSEASARRVTGRGVPVEKNFNADGTKRSGGQAKGVRVRGTQKVGDQFHDFCECEAVPVFRDTLVQMNDDATEHFKAYEDARNEVERERKAAGYKGYGDQAESRKMILSKMRTQLGTN